MRFSKFPHTHSVPTGVHSLCCFQMLMMCSTKRLKRAGVMLETRSLLMIQPAGVSVLVAFDLCSCGGRDLHVAEAGC